MDVEDVDGADRDVRPAAQAGRRSGPCGPPRSPGSTGSAGGPSTSRRSVTTRSDAPRRERATASRASRSRAAARPAGPALGSHVASSVRTVAPLSWTATSRPSRSATIGRWRRAVRGARGIPPSSAGRRPSSTRRSMTTRSRSGSIAGLVTWAKAWRRWSATGRSSRPRPGVGVSSPMLQSGSWPFEGHRLDVEPRALGVQPGEVAQGMRGLGAVRRDGGLEAILVDGSRRVVDRQPAQDAVLGVGVLHDRVAARLHEQQLAGPEPAAADRLGRAERDGAGLRRDRDHPVAGHREGRRPQAVAIDERADPPAVGEDDRGRAVPRRRGSRPSAAAGWRRGDAARGAGRAPRGSRSAGPASAPSRSPSGARAPRRATASRSRPARGAGPPRAARGPGRNAAASPAAADLLAVPAHRVDLAVVGDRPERLGQPPDRVGVRRVALVEDRVAEAQRRPQVRVEVGQPPADDQALVDDRPGRGGRDGDLGERPAGRARRGLQPAPGDDQAALEGVVGDRPAVIRAARWPRDDRLGEGRSRCRRRRAQGSDVARDGAPGRDRQAGLGEDRLDQGAGPSFGRSSARQEERDDPRAGRPPRPGRPAARAASDRAAGRRPRRRSIRRRPRTRRDGRARPGRPAPAAGPESRERPPASATNPTPQASCSKRASYSGVAGRRWRGRWLGSMAVLRERGRIGRRREGRQRPIADGGDVRTRGRPSSGGARHT